jgi:hypothetical protein
MSSTDSCAIQNVPARSSIVRASGLQGELETQLTSLQFETIQTHAGEKTFEAVVGDLLK